MFNRHWLKSLASRPNGTPGDNPRGVRAAKNHALRHTSGRASFRLRLEELEPRLAPATQVVFFESAVADYQVLRQGLGADVEAVVLDSRADGLKEMAAFLAGRHDLMSIGVVAHGAPGAVELGTALLNEQSLGSYAPQLAAFRSALARSGELDLWSCDVGAGPGGTSLVRDLSIATGAGIAAADHKIGSAAQGGDWQLDVRTGGARGLVPFSDASQGAFGGLLGGTWAPAASMTTARLLHTATLLPSGKVLVVGGYDSASNTLASAELYDPATNTWTAAGALATAREGHTATLLSNGRVLVAGGTGGTIAGHYALSSAELYDPISNTWSAAGAMPATWNGQTATLLANGQVLVAGGYSNDILGPSAALYDPVSNTWSLTGSMSQFHIEHTATLLTNGKVLVAGNSYYPASTSTAELYDPGTKTWSLAASMTYGRGGHTATLLASGQVLVAGDANTGASSEIYNPVSNTWSTAASMLTERGRHTATLLANGQVLVTGGETASTLTGQLSSAELYDPVTNTWTFAGAMPTTRLYQTATLLNNGQVLVAGGEVLTSDSQGGVLNVALSSAVLCTPGPVDLTQSTITVSSTQIPLRGSATITLAAKDKAGNRIASPNLPFTFALAIGTGSGIFLDVTDNNDGTYTATFIGTAPGTVIIAATLAGQAIASTQATLTVGSAFGVPGWRPTASMATARYSQTATLLASGKVLVVGGTDATGQALASAELYDPATGNWSSAGSMAAARVYHTATLLANGKVLVAGGGGLNVSSQSSAELYDPISNTWSAAASMPATRARQTATLLANGKVLLAGGISGSGSIQASAVLYDPATDTWSAAASMATFRYFHTATLLTNGKVLVAGGGVGLAGAAFKAELYDPATNTWSAAAPMSYGRQDHTATLLASGQVLVAGNGTAELYNPASNTWSAAGLMTGLRFDHAAVLLKDGKVLVAGGYDNGAGSLFPASAELYDPVGNTWSYAGSMSYDRALETATLLNNGQVLVTGGSYYDYKTGPGSHVLASAELYVPAATILPGTWGPVAPMTAPREDQTTTLLPSGKVLVVGGVTTGGQMGGPALYDPIGNTWSTAGSMSTPRFQHTATLLPNGKVLVAGGTSSVLVQSPGDLSSAELYDPATNAWSAAAPMPTVRGSHTATLLNNGQVLVTGGVTNGLLLKSAVLYDPASNTWSVAASMANFREFHSATLLASGKVLVAGDSFGGSIAASAELYDPATNSWSAAGSMAQGRFEHTATLLASGRVLVAGGIAAGSSPSLSLSSSEIYDPVSNTWSAASSMVTARVDHTATLLKNGQVLVTGGSLDTATADTPLSSTELYDPISGTWSSAGSMSAARWLDTATLLNNGQVLVAGGQDDTPKFLASAELYTPAGASPTQTTTALNSTANPAGYGQSITFTATVTAGGSPVTSGTVDFDDGTAVLASGVALDAGGHAVATTASLSATASPHLITAFYNGTVQIPPSSVTMNESVSQRPLTVTADSRSKTYGAAEPALTYQITAGSLVSGDAISGALTRAPGENAGSYAIGQGALALNSNYALTFVGANLTVVPAKFQVSLAGASTVVAGYPFLFTAQALDPLGNAVTSYQGPGTVTAITTPADAQANTPFAGTLNRLGTAYLLGNLKTAGTYTLTSTASDFIGTSSVITVTPAAAVYFKITVPSTAITGTPISVIATAYDQYGNIATSYTGTVHFTSSDASASAGGSLPPNYTFTAADAGVHVFTNGVTLKTAGSQTIAATDTSPNLPIIMGTSSAVAVSGLQVAALASTPTGFIVIFNKPFLAADITMYGVGATAQDVTLAGDKNGSISGTLLFDTTNTIATFKASAMPLDNINSFVNGGAHSVVLPDDHYTVTIKSGTGSGSSANGFFDLSNVPLDGNSNAGHANYTFTFATSYQSSATRVLAIPDFARGPDDNSVIKVPNDSGHGIQVALYNAANVTDVTCTVTFNSALLAITAPGASTADSSGTGTKTFTMTSSTATTATFHYTSTVAQSGIVILGDILANDPNTSVGSYGQKELLTLGSVTVNGTAFTGVVANAIHVNAYLGDVSGDGVIGAADVNPVFTTAIGSSTGFGPYSLVDPTIVGDVTADGAVDGSDVAYLKAYILNHASRPKIPVPPGLTGIASPSAVGPTPSFVGGQPLTPDPSPLSTGTRGGGEVGSPAAILASVLPLTPGSVQPAPDEFQDTRGLKPCASPAVAFAKSKTGLTVSFSMDRVVADWIFAQWANEMDG